MSEHTLPLVLKDLDASYHINFRPSGISYLKTTERRISPDCCPECYVFESASGKKYITSKCHSCRESALQKYRIINIQN